MLDELLTEFSSSFLTRELEKMKASEPEKYEQTQKMMLTASEVLVHFLRESTDFRKAFARVHNEFLKHPECRSSINQAIQAAHKFEES